MVAASRFALTVPPRRLGFAAAGLVALCLLLTGLVPAFSHELGAAAYDSSPAVPAGAPATGLRGGASTLAPQDSLEHRPGSIPAGSGPQGVLFDPSNGYLYVSNQGSNNLTVIDPKTNSTVRSIAVGSNPVIAAYDAENGYLYVPNYYSGNVSVVDPATNSTVRSIPVGADPYGIAYDSVDHDLYVTNDGSDTVSVIDGSSQTVVDTIDVGLLPYGIVYDPVSDDLAVVDLASGNLTLIDGSTNHVVGSIPISPTRNISPGGATTGNVVTFDPANGCLYIANNYPNGEVVVVDGATDAVVARIPVGPSPDGVAYDALNGELYVANYASENVSVINAADNAVVGTLPAGAYPYAVAFDPVVGSVYVTNQGSGNVSVYGTVASPAYAVSFTETGLAPGTAWGVTLEGATNATTGSSVGFVEWDGTYAFTCTPVAGYSLSVSSGEVSVAGAPVSVSVVFTPSSQTTYALTFTEAGLAPGTLWSVTTNGTPGLSASKSIGFEEPHGTFEFSVSPIAGYAAVPGSGVASVAGGPLSIEIRFLPLFSVTVTESGLPQGTSWSVTINGTTQGSTASSLVFDEPNGSVPFTVHGVRGYAADPSSGSVVVNGGPAGVSIRFAKPTYSVTFTATFPTKKHQLKTLEKKGWTVVLNGTTMHSVTPTISFPPVQNGTLPVLVFGPSGYQATGSGIVTVKGATSVPVTITKGKTVTLSFREKGLKHVSWCTSLDGDQLCSSKSKERFVDLTPGTYAYAIGNVSGYRATAKLGKTAEPLSGPIDLTRSSTLKVTFSTGGGGGEPRSGGSLLARRVGRGPRNA